MIDFVVRTIIEKNPNMLIPWYLMLSYGYYILDESMVKDTFYDEICKKLIDKWDEIDHTHKYLIDKSALDAGTGFYLTENSYPSIVKFAYINARKEYYYNK